MNYATKLCILSMVSVFSVSSIGLVQAADTPIVSTGGVAYNIGLQGATFSNSDNAWLTFTKSDEEVIPSALKISSTLRFFLG